MAKIITIITKISPSGFAVEACSHILIISIGNGCAAKSGSIILAEGSSVGRGGDRHAWFHIAKLWTATVEIHKTIVDSHIDSSRNAGLRSSSPTKETIDTGMVNLGRQIHGARIVTSVGTGFNRRFHIGAKEFMDAASGTPEIDILAVSFSFTITSHKALLNLTTRHIDRNKGISFALCTVVARIEFFYVRFSAYLVILQLCAWICTAANHLGVIPAIDNAAVIPSVAVTTVEIIRFYFKLGGTGDAGLRYLKPSMGFINGNVGIVDATMKMRGHTQRNLCYEVVTCWWHSGAVHCVVGIQGVVGLLVVVSIDAHDGKAFFQQPTRYGLAIPMVIAYQHHRLLVDRAFSKHLSQSSIQGMVDSLAMKKVRCGTCEACPLFVASSSSSVIISSTISIVCNLIVFVAQVECRSEICSDFDIRDAVWHNIVASLGKDEARVGIKVFIGAITVGNIVVVIITNTSSTRCATSKISNLPACANLGIICIHLKLIGKGQHHLAPGEVIVQRIHIRDGQTDRMGIITNFDGYRQIAIFTHLGEQLSCIVVGGGRQIVIGRCRCGLRVLRPRLNNGICGYILL